MKRRIGIVTLLLGVCAGIGVGLFWMPVDPSDRFPSPLREPAWAVAALACGLVWLVAEYGWDRRRTLRDGLRQLRKIDQEGH